jgi:glycosidase
MLLTMPGAPFIYYGEELGLLNGPGNEDEWKRTPMLWTDAGPGYGFTTGTPWHATAASQLVPSRAAQVTDSESLWTHYRKLIAARHDSLALSQGTLEVLAPAGKVLAFTRTSASEMVVVVHNLASSAQTVALAVKGSALKPLFVDPGVEASKAEGGFSVSLAPLSTGIFRVEP